MKIIMLCACLMLAGCATTSTTTAVDTFCLTAHKIQWSVNDTPETIQKIEIHNRTIDLRCGGSSKKA